MTNPYQTKEFKELQAKWAKKLEKDGFEDIETLDGKLKGISHADFFKAHYNQIDAQAKEEYYRQAGYFLYEHKFKNELERKIWELHLEGVGIREIVKVLKKRRHKVYKRMVHEILRPLVEKLLKKIKL
jgi:glutamine synthetase adenylyltransferase